MRARHVGLLAGVIVAVIWSAFGLGAVVLAVICGAVGWLVGMAFEGDLDLQRIIDALRRK